MGQRRFVVVSGFWTPGAASRWPNGSGVQSAGAPWAGAWYAWRLLGANNRELGRSGHAYPDEQACLEAVRRLRTDISRAEPVVHVAWRTGRWTWEMHLGYEAVGVSARSFERKRDCESNYGSFVGAVPDAEWALPTGEGSAGLGARAGACD